MIVNGVTLTAGLAGIVLAIVLAGMLLRPAKRPQERRQAMRKGTHPAGNRHVTQEWHAAVATVPPSSSTPAGLALTWHHLADMAMRSAFSWHELGQEQAAYEAWQRAQAHRAEARRWEHEARTELETGRTVDVRA